MVTQNRDIMREAILKDMSNRIEIIKKSFKNIANENVRKVPEEIFMTFFLPLFSGENKTNRDLLLEHWYTIAGTPYNPVNIVNINGDVVAVVPPILDRNILQMKKDRSKIDLPSMFEIAVQKASISPMLGNRIVTNELNNRFLTTVNKEPNTEIQNDWLKLLSHYGKNVKGNEKEIVGKQIESDFVYD